jgi:ATP-binding cassette subfamily B protein
MKFAFHKIRTILQVNRAIALVWSAGRAWVMAGLFASILLGGLPLASLYLHKLIIDTVSGSATAGENAQTAVVGLVAVLGILELTALLCRQIHSYLTEAQAQIVQDRIADLVHAKSIEVDLAFYENADYQNTLHRAQMLAPSRAGTLVQLLSQILRSGISLIAVFGFLLTFHWGLALFLVLAVLPGLITRLRSADLMFEFQKATTEQERLGWYYHSMNTAAGNAKEVRVFHLGELFRRWHRELRVKIRHERMRITRRRILVEFAVQCGATVAQYSGYLYVAVQTVRGEFTLGDLVMFYQTFARAQTFLQQLLQGLASLYENNLILGQLFAFLDTGNSVRSPVLPATLPEPNNAAVEFKNVQFSYPGSQRSALSDINLTIRPGEHIAIVGKNGSGKTTLVKLLCRLYDPTGGQITLAGRPLPDFNVPEYRRQFSVLFQDYLQHPFSVRQNIWFGDITGPPETDQIRRAAQLTGADEFIAKLPQQYETVLGRRFQDGEELSQGEWQKIALARALQRPYGFVILDEPTSSMDPEAEYRIFQQFNAITRDRTAILISHRMNTVRMADRIYVMEDGRIVENGTHEELVAAGCLYAHLFETQASHFR